MPRDDLAPKREKKAGFGAPVNREVPLEQLESVAVAKFAKSALAYDSLEQAFPPADPDLTPFGTDVLVQIRTPRRYTKGGIYMPDESRETDLWNMQVAKVIALGPVAFRDRETLKPWPESFGVGFWRRAWNKLTGKVTPWCKPGDYVRVPKYGGDRWWVDVPDSEDGKALFVLFDDLVMKGRVPDAKVLDMVAYI